MEREYSRKQDTTNGSGERLISDTMHESPVKEVLLRRERQKLRNRKLWMSSVPRTDDHLREQLRQRRILRTLWKDNGEGSGTRAATTTKRPSRGVASSGGEQHHTAQGTRTKEASEQESFEQSLRARSDVIQSRCAVCEESDSRQASPRRPPLPGQRTKDSWPKSAARAAHEVPRRR